MQVGNSINGLQLDDNTAPDEKVEAALAHAVAFVANLNRRLPDKSYPAETQFVRERFLIDRFEIARTDRPMYFQCRVDD